MATLIMRTLVVLAFATLVGCGGGGDSQTNDTTVANVRVWGTPVQPITQPLETSGAYTATVSGTFSNSEATASVIRVAVQYAGPGAYVEGPQYLDYILGPGQSVAIDQTLKFRVDSAPTQVSVALVTSGPLGIMNNLNLHLTKD